MDVINLKVFLCFQGGIGNEWVKFIISKVFYNVNETYVAEKTFENYSLFCKDNKGVSCLTHFSSYSISIPPENVRKSKVF